MQNEVNGGTARVHFYLVLVGLAVVVTLLATLWWVRHIVQTSVPQAGAVLEARVNIGEAHLWLMELIGGDHVEEADKVWEDLARSRVHLKALLDEDGDRTLVAVPLTNESERVLATQVLKDLDHFEALSRQCVANLGSQEASVSLDSQMDATFERYIETSTMLLNALHARTAADVRIFLYTQGSLAAVIFLAFGWVILLLRRKDAIEHDSHLAALRASFAEIEASRAELERQNRVNTVLVQLTEKLQGIEDVTEIAQRALDALCEQVDAKVGVCWASHGGAGLVRLAARALPAERQAQDMLMEGEGLVGRAASDGRAIVMDVPSDYLPVSSALGGSPAQHLRILPLVHDERAIGVLELAFLNKPDALSVAVIDAAVPAIAIRLFLAMRAESMRAM